MARQTPEGKLWQSFRKGMLGLERDGNAILLDRIESGMTGRGIPDVHMTDRHLGDCWVELKVAKGNKVNITALQVDWLTRRAALGCRTRIMALTYAPSTARECLKIWNGADAQRVAIDGLSCPGIATIPGTPGFPWYLVRLALFCQHL